MPQMLAALGGRPSGARLRRLLQSPHYRDGAFHNTAPTRTLSAEDSLRVARELARGGRERRPGRIPVVTPSVPSATSGAALTWYGHATVLVEIDSARVLIDPLWSDRCSPLSRMGPKRLHRVPAALTDLPRLDAIVISHDHYDHLDMPTVQALARLQDAPFLMPLGVGAHLERWGVPEARIIELDWEENATVAGLTLTATEAQHFSGRGLRRDGTLWSSWVVAGAHRKAFYTGDSGYFDGYAQIGAEHGPFDVTLMQIGAYDRAWPSIHMFPEEAVTAHLDLRGDLLIPVHWATFNLALHDWSEPVDRLWAEAKARDVRLAVPRPGERVVVDDPPAVDGWWQAVA